MFDGIQRRVASLWFPRLASDRVLRACPLEGPFALTLKQKNANRIYCLNRDAARQGLHRGMSDDNWRSGLRDYWRVETKEGRRLWLFYTPQNLNWFVQGEFA